MEGVTAAAHYMALNDDFILAFNRGVLSPLARTRADIKRAGMSAETQMNWIPRSMGPMSLRPGLQYLGSTATADGAVRHIPFIYSNSDTALIEITDEKLRLIVDDAPVVRPSVATVTSNGGFDTDLTDWTSADQGTAVSAWQTGGYMSLTGTGSQGAVRHQLVTPSGGDMGIEHGVDINVASGTVGLRIGTTPGLDDIFGESYLAEGVHSVAFTPTTGFYIVLFNRTAENVLVNSVQISPAGVVETATALLPEETLDELRYAQSGDVVFLARGIDKAPAKVERRSPTSWSLVGYTPDSGPWRLENISPVTITPSALSGSVTLTASQAIFRSGNVGSLYTLTSEGQAVTKSLGAGGDATDPIRVVGITGSRIFAFTITGTWAGTVTLEQSVTEPDNWVTITDYTSNQDLTYDDGLDNQVTYYRLRFTTYTSGTAVGTLSIATGSIRGVARITSVTDGSTAVAQVLKPFGAAAATRIWSEGAWSARRGYPSAVAFFGGRIWWAGRDRVWGSVVDDFENFDPDYEGDAGPINRSIGSGPVDTINWLVPLRQLLLGAGGAEYLCRSTGFEEPITPSNFNLRPETSYGSARVEPVKIDNSVVFVDRTGARIMQSDASVDGIETTELSILTPEICLPDIKRVAVQRRPDTRVHFVRCDGTAVVLVYDKTEQVNCFITVETEGLIEDVAVLPNIPEDDVYYTVARVVNGAVVRYLEKWAYTEEAIGGAVNKMADSFKVYSGTSTDTITGLDHLEGKTVVAWGNSKDLGTYVVASGSITLSEAVTCAVVGLPYYADFKSGKLSLLTEGAPTLSKKRRIVRAALILRNTHKQGLEFGSDFDHLDNLPLIEDEAAVAADKMWETYDQDPHVLNGTLENDTRLCLRATAPRPCTVMAVVMNISEA